VHDARDFMSNISDRVARHDCLARKMCIKQPVLGIS